MVTGIRLDCGLGMAGDAARGDEGDRWDGRVVRSGRTREARNTQNEETNAEHTETNTHTCAQTYTYIS